MGKDSVRYALSIGIESASRYSRYLGYVSMTAMGLIVTIDVSGRYLFNRPLKGGPELVEQLMVCVIFLMLPYVTGAERHIKVDALVLHIARIAPRTQRAATATFDIIMLVMLAFLSWQAFAGSIYALHSGEVTDSLGIPHYPFWFVMAGGFFLAFLSFFMRFAQSLAGKGRE